MKQEFLPILVLFLSFQIAHSQNHTYCKTIPVKSAWLENYQQNPQIFKTSGDILFVPLTIHLVGTDEGEGYYPMQELLDDLCRLNEFFEPVEIQFFLEGEPNYIKNSGWYLDPIAEEMMPPNNVANTVNCYFVNSEFFSGFYNSVYDGVVLSWGGLTGIESLWAHEMGHFFSLLHTFLGWESSNFFNFSIPAPEFIGGYKVERVDGTDCDIAGDGFCDTPPDYLWNIGWPCLMTDQSVTVQTDPIGFLFRSDGSLIMSYSLCAHRFSQEQINAMQANLIDERPELIFDGGPLAGIPNSGVNLIAPAQGATVSTDEPLSLEWEAVPNATKYLVDLTFLPYFSAVYDQYVVENNNLIINNLLIGKDYLWRVKPYNPFDPCADYSVEGLFSTPGLTGTIEFNDDPEISLYPNPVSGGSTLVLEVHSDESDLAGIVIYDMQGRVGQTDKFRTISEGTDQLYISIQELPKGVYLLCVDTSRGTWRQRFIVGE